MPFSDVFMTCLVFLCDTQCISPIKFFFRLIYAVSIRLSLPPHRIQTDDVSEICADAITFWKLHKHKVNKLQDTVTLKPDKVLCYSRSITKLVNKLGVYRYRYR